MELGKAIETRKSVRNFSTKKPDWRKILQVMDYARFSPMAGNCYTLKYILVSDKKKIELIEGACQQKFVGKASYILVVVSDREKVKKLYDLYNKGFGAQQAGAAIQNILLGLTEKGIATCWVGFFEDSIIKRELEISDSLTVEAVLPLGIESRLGSGVEKRKPDLDSLIFFDKWGKKHMGEDTKQAYEAS
jgi:nitroreductase